MLKSEAKVGFITPALGRASLLQVIVCCIVATDKNKSNQSQPTNLIFF